MLNKVIAVQDLFSVPQVTEEAVLHFVAISRATRCTEQNQGMMHLLALSYYIMEPPESPLRGESEIYKSGACFFKAFYIIDNAILI